jgi:hypothetical protein
MSSIANVASSNALSLLTGPSGPLSNLPQQLQQSVLESASPSDLLTLSTTALGLQEITGLFGGSSTGDTSQILDPAQAMLSAVYGVTPPPTAAAQASDLTQSMLSAAYGIASPSSPASIAAGPIGTIVDTVG